jgi:hypothetical protein
VSKRRRWTNIKCAIATFHAGLVAEDSKVIEALIHVQDDPEGLLVRSQAARILANLAFLKSIEGLEIPHGENPFAEVHVFLGDELAFGLLAGNWKIQGPIATMPPEERMGGAKQRPPPPLMNVRGVWKLNLTPTRPQAPRQALAAQIDKYTQVLNKVTADIAAGRLKTVEQVRQALTAAPKFAPPDYMPDLVLSLPIQP